MTNGRRELGEQVVAEEGFPIMTTPILTPLVPSPVTTPTQAHEGIVTIQSPFWLPDNQGNSPDQSLFPLMIPPLYYSCVNQGKNAAPKFHIGVATPSQSSLAVTSIAVPTVPMENLPSAFMPVRLTSVVPTSPLQPVVMLEREPSTKNPNSLKLRVTYQTSIENLKKKTASSDKVKCLQSLADGVYDEMLSLKYKWPSFTKFDRTGNPIDHITIF